MSSLSNEQKELLLDNCIGLTSKEEAAEAEALISSAFAPLEALEPESCPDELAEGAIWRLTNHARSSQDRLEQLLAAEETKELASAKGQFWRNLGKMAATAAVIMVFASIYFALSSFARQKSWQQACGAQLGRIWEGIDQYISDHDDQLPAVAIEAGQPWWKVGYQGKEDQSITRGMWRLVRDHYVNPSEFVCPGRKRASAKPLDMSQVQNYNDFRSRDDITYSVRIWCGKPRRESVVGRKVFMTDSNPIFENLPRDFSRELKLRLDKRSLAVNSRNHKGRGQNVLFCDGSVEFIKVRRIGISKDDVFTLECMYQGFEVRGCEMPSCETDAFAAP